MTLVILGNGYENGQLHSIELTARLVLAANLPLGDKFFSNRPNKYQFLLEKRGKSDKT